MESFKKLSKDYFHLYGNLSDAIQTTTYWAYSELYAGNCKKEKTRRLMIELSKKLEEAKELAKELSDHLSWDI